jgi:hypothetical protein
MTKRNNSAWIPQLFEYTFEELGLSRVTQMECISERGNDKKPGNADATAESPRYFN